MSKDVKVGERWVVAGKALGEFEMDIEEKCGAVYYGRGCSQHPDHRTRSSWQVQPVFDGSKGSEWELHFIRRIAPAPQVAAVGIGPDWGKRIADAIMREAKAAEAKYEAPKPACGGCGTDGEFPERVTSYPESSRSPKRVIKQRWCEPCLLRHESSLAYRMERENRSGYTGVQPSTPAMGPLRTMHGDIVGGWNKRAVK